MKILIDAHIFDGKFQGTRTYIKGLYSKMILQRTNWEFIFVGQNIEELRLEFGDWDHVEYIPLKSGNKFVRLLLEIPYIIYKHKVDYSHFQYISPLLKTGKTIITVHDILFEEKRYKHLFSAKYRILNGFLFKKSAASAHIVLTVSDYSKIKINELYKIDKKDIYITPNAIDVDYSNLSQEVDISHKYRCKKYILYVSRIEPRKNHIGLLKAFVNLKLDQQGYEIVFVGNRDMKDEDLDGFIQNNQEVLRDRLHFYANVSDQDLKQLYINCEFAVYLSLAEGFGIPPLEAAVYGKKVICSNLTAMSEFNFFKHHIDPTNLEAIQEAIKGIIKGDVNNADAVRTAILEKYDWSRSAEELISVIEKKESITT